MKIQRLKGQSAIVTGASSGIGTAVAIALANEGAKVVVNYSHSEKAAFEIVRGIEKDGGEAIAIKADVSREGDVKDMFKEAIASFGTVDILVNNAGIQKDAS